MRKPFVLLALLCLPLAPRVQADDASDARQAIQAAYDRESDAWARKDVSALHAMGAFPDIKMPPVHAKMPPGLSPEERRQFAANDRQMNAQLNADVTRMILKNLLENTTFLSATATVQNVALNGKAALVTAKTHGVWVISDPKTHQDNTRVMDVITQDAWRQTAGGWKKRASKTLWQSQTLNGKPVIPNRVK